MGAGIGTGTRIRGGGAGGGVGGGIGGVTTVVAVVRSAADTPSRPARAAGAKLLFAALMASWASVESAAPVTVLETSAPTPSTTVWIAWILPSGTPREFAKAAVEMVGAAPRTMPAELPELRVRLIS